MKFWKNGTFSETVHLKCKMENCKVKLGCLISTNINEVIRPILNILVFFFTIRFCKYKKA